MNKQDVKEDGKTQRTQAKEEGKIERTQAKQENKTDRTQIRQEEKTKRSCKWWLWLVIGFICGKVPIKKIVNSLK